MDIGNLHIVGASVCTIIEQIGHIAGKFCIGGVIVPNEVLIDCAISAPVCFRAENWTIFEHKHRGLNTGIRPEPMRIGSP
ncbi:hypothetical protein ABID19_003729 [Mesorhizobium robiniae]|uniref:Uncharacterized protein n=1 Tax=Mesorhizobium robiniae TaxID=559315 RepID=A0ABV2GQX3_9HYPH